MVCERCIIFVRQVLQQLEAFPSKIELGHVIFSAPDELVLLAFERKLNEAGLYIVRDKIETTVEDIKVQIAEYLDGLEAGKKGSKLSKFLADQLARNYYGLTKLFSKHENRTIESYTIEKKIERAKRLLLEGELTLSEISHRLGYSTVQHLSNQFRRATGLSVSEFKAINYRMPTLTTNSNPLMIATPYAA